MKAEKVKLEDGEEVFVEFNIIDDSVFKRQDETTIIQTEKEKGVTTTYFWSKNINTGIYEWQGFRRS